MTDLHRNGTFHQKRSICLFSSPLIEGLETCDILAATDDHFLANLPPTAEIIDAWVHVEVVSDAVTSVAATLGTTEGGSEILSAADLKTAVGKTGTFTGNTLTGTGVPLWLGLIYTGAVTNVGKYIITVEYIEYEKWTGEYTKLTNSPA